MKTTLVILIAFLVTGCITVPQTKENLQKNAEFRERLVLKGNYQKLVRCWNTAAAKEMYGSSVDRTTTSIFTDVEVGEIAMGGSAGLYSTVITLKQIPSGEVEVEGYATGHLGKKYFGNWIEVLKKCSINQ